MGAVIVPLILLIVLYLAYFSRNYATPSYRYLTSMTLSMLVAFLGLLFLIGGSADYFDITMRTFGIGGQLGSWLILNNPGPRWSTALVNVGVFGFLLFIYVFALSVSHGGGRPTLQVRDWVILGLLLLQLLLYDPHVFVVLDTLGVHMPPVREWLNRVGTVAFKVLDLTVLYAAFAMLNRYRIHFPQKFSLRRSTGKYLLGLLPTCAFFIILFYWFPRVVLKTTLLDHVYLTDFTQVAISAPLLWVVSVLLVVSHSILFVVLLRSVSVESYFSTREIHIHSTAELSVRAFSHSMKNDLIAILGELDAIQSDSSGPSSTVSRSLTSIHRHARHAMDRLEDLSHKVKFIGLTLQRVTLAETVKAAMSQLQFRGIDVSVETGSAEVEVLVDVRHMEDVFYNLLQNAVGAVCDTRSPRITVRIARQTGWAIATVTDNGRGIAPESIESIFVPFFTTGNTSTNWGVGLSYCRRVIQAHEGEILVDSTPGRGSTFTVMLPVVGRCE